MLAITASASMALSACSADTPQPSETSSPTGSTTEELGPAVRGSELPIDATPQKLGQGEQGQCPYLDGEWVQNTNGQRLTGVGVDERFDPPACIFWSYEDQPQVQVMVRTMRTNKDAVAVVDHAAPIDSTLKALEPQGWSGGRRGGNETSGALYAVWKDRTAVVVFTAQDQSLKAQTIAEETIKNLGL